MLKTKRKGYEFETLATELLNRYVNGSMWKRIPGSGAIGTFMKEPLLQSDIAGVVKAFPKGFRIEAKVGYGGATQLTMKKEWLDKNIADATNSNSIPLLMGKFSGARDGVKVFVAMDFGTFCEIMNRVTELHEEIEKYDCGQLGKDKGLL